MFLYWPVSCLVFITRHLPLRLCYWIAGIIGDLVYVFWPKGRRNVVDNMRHVLGPEASEQEAKDTARRSFQNYLRLLVDFARAAATDPAEIEARLHGTGWEHLDEAFRHGKGVLLVGTHLGSWEAAGVALAGRGYRVHAISETLGNKGINRLAIESRAARGIELIPMEYALRRAYRALRRNEAVGLVTDRPLPPDEGTPVMFFGHQITWPTGPAVLALKTGAKIVTGYLVTNANNDYVGEILPPLDTRASGDHEADVQRITQEIVRIHEDLIRRYPDQWYMFRRMWPKAHGPS
jgi:lauroyl/myristoyl acyltransferase